jgi:hypothetical protein
LSDLNPPVPRPAMRGAVREKTSRELAEARAAEIMGHMGDLDEGQDKFHVPLNEIPDGWTYEWKTRTVYNQENPAYQVSLARTGWEPVPASRHPAMMPKDSSSQTIERDGQVLMMRPEVITDQVRGIERRKARDQVRVKEQQLGSERMDKFGEAGRASPATIRKSYEPMAIPETV